MKSKIKLGGNGFGNDDTIDKKQIELCKDWIQKWITPRKTINDEKGSYGLKHVVERNTNTYISNGAFIKAAIDLGYKYKQYDLNASFNMSFVKAKKNLKESSFNRP